MKVICPKCQFENQADSSRVVCARCATIIEVRMDQGTGVDTNGKRQTARLPFATNTPSGGSQPLGSQSLNQSRDVYATRVGDDFDDVLDIPRPSQSGYPAAAESSPVFEDVFATPNYEPATSYEFSPFEKKPTNPIESFQTGTPRQRETQDYAEAPEPEFMGWPVLPENSIDEEEGSGSSRGGLFLRVGLIVTVFGLLCALAYYFLGDFIAKKRRGQDGSLVASNAATQTGGNTSSSPLPASSPAARTETADNDATSVAPPIVTPKPPDSAVAQNPASGKQVDVPPLDGRSGHSQPAKPAPPAGSNLPPTPNRGNLTVQVGSYTDQAQADEHAGRLRSAKVDARVVRADVPGRGTRYRVQVGGFATREEATNYGNLLRSRGLTTDFAVMTIGK